MELKGQKDLPRTWLGVGLSHIAQEHLRGSLSIDPHLPLVLGDSLTAEGHAELQLTSLFPPLARFHIPPVVGKTMALKYVHALIPGPCKDVTLQKGFHWCD